jgi:broad specificity phosphatase PhoE
MIVNSAAVSPYFLIELFVLVSMITFGRALLVRTQRTTKPHSIFNYRIQHLEMSTSTPAVDKRIVIIRHGQTEMNEHLSRQPWGSPRFRDARLWDTVLSLEGIRQAKDLNKRMSRSSSLLASVELIVSSPLTRAIQTADIAFHNLLPSIPRIVTPYASERLYLSSDVGQPKAELISRYTTWDFSEISDEMKPWWYTPEAVGGEYIEWRPPGDYACPGEPGDIFRARIEKLKGWLENRPEQVICLVTHWGVARNLTGCDLHNCQVKEVLLSDIMRRPFIDE